MEEKEKTLVIGNGQIGKALTMVLSFRHKSIYSKDVEELELDGVKWLHICYPYSDKFVDITRNYIRKYNPDYTIIHSTIKVGTTRELGKNVWHSPVRGLHPNLVSGITTFVKYIGGEYNKEVEDYFREAGIQIVFTPKPETTELGKLLDTTYYGWNIAFCKEAEKMCRKYGADFTITYTHMNQTYNEGYAKLGKPNVTRPVLIPVSGKIGGHCVIPNCALLKEKISRILIKLNMKW